MTGPENAQIAIRDSPDEGAYVIDVDGVRAGKTEYRMREGRHVFVHTEIDDAHSGAGLGAMLVRFALDDVRSQAGRIVPLCPFVNAFIRRHPEYDDLVDHEMTSSLRSRKR